MEPQTRKTPRGWKRIKKTAAAVAAELEEREIAIESDATGWLTLTPAAAAEASDRIAGTLTAAAALSREVCAGCAGAGDPVRRADGGLTTRCRDCRAKGDEVLSRGWRAPKREPEAQELEAVIGKAELTALMNAVAPRKNPDRHWPHKIVSGAGVCASGIGAHGWNHLIRTAYGELVPANGEGGCATIVQIKEKFGGLVIYKNRNTPFREGFMRMINRYSEQVCIRCGKPGRLRNVRMTAEGPKHTGGWIRPECPRCWDKNARK